MTTILGGEPGHIQSWRWKDYGSAADASRRGDRARSGRARAGWRSKAGFKQWRAAGTAATQEGCLGIRAVLLTKDSGVGTASAAHSKREETRNARGHWFQHHQGCQPGNVAKSPAELAQLAEQAVAQAAAEGLILHRSNTNKTGFKGVKKNVSKTSYRSRKTGAPRPLPFFLLLLLQPKRQHSAMPAASCDVLLACSVV